MIDIVIVANSRDSRLWEMTANAIKSAVKHASYPIGNIVTIEQASYAREQKIGRTLYYDFEFNYNECLNLGRTLCKSQYVAFCNNDLYFERNWARNIVNAMEAHGYLSASPSSKYVFNGVVEGYDIGKKGQLLGWCIVTDQEVFEHIGRFDTPVQFWYSDNVYGVQLKCAGIKHALIGSSLVRHLGGGSVTLKAIGSLKRARYMRAQEEFFIEYKKQKYAIAGIEI